MKKILIGKLINQIENPSLEDDIDVIFFNISSLQIKNISESERLNNFKNILNYINIHKEDEKNKEELNYIECKFLIKLINSDLINKEHNNSLLCSLLSEYKNSLLEIVSENIKKIQDNLKNVEDKKELKRLDNKINNYKEMRKVIESVEDFKIQKKIDKKNPFFVPENLKNLRLSDLKSILKKEENKKYLDRDLLIELIIENRSKIISKELTNNELLDYYKILENRRDELGNREVNKNTLSSKIEFLNIDLVKSLSYKENWDDIPRYSLIEIKNKSKKEKKEERYLFVYTIDKNLYFSPMKLNEKYIQHIMIAKGSSVLNAGGIKINEDGEIDSINNLSGHYCPPVDNMQTMKNILLDNSNIKIEYMDTDDEIKIVGVKDYFNNFLTKKINFIENKNNELNEKDINLKNKIK